jgi:cardiolipin synthase
MVVDDCWVSVGSTNFDNRSFRLNDEANLNAIDPDVAHEQASAFETDKKASLRISLHQWQSRPWHEKAVETLAGLLRSQV